MTLYVKSGGAYALAAATKIKIAGSYTAVAGNFTKVAGVYQPVSYAPSGPYMGIVTNGLHLPNTSTGTSTQSLSRTRHTIRANGVSYLQAKWVNWMVQNNDGGLETGIGASATLYGSLIVGGSISAGAIVGGTRYPLTWNGATSVVVANKTTSSFHDPIIVAAANGSVIWYQIAWECSSGIVYEAGTAGAEAQDNTHGEQFRFAASGLDLTQANSTAAWSGGSTSTNLLYRPWIIVSTITDPSVAYYGTSIDQGFKSSANNVANGDHGILGRALGAYCGYSNCGQGGSTALQFLSTGDRTLRMEASYYCSHVVFGGLINDLNSAAAPSAPVVAGYATSVAALFNRLVYGATVTPYTTGAWTAADGSDQTLFNVNTFAARRTAYNALVRAGISGYTNFFDVAAGCALGGLGDDTKWYADGTANFMFQTAASPDGLHPGTQGETRFIAQPQNTVSTLITRP